MMRPLGIIVAIPVWLYQRLISPIIPARCNYYPTCSEYSRRALIRHGLIKGSVMSVMRIGRCSARYYGGNDDVPETFDWEELKREYRERSVRRHQNGG